MSQWKYQIDTAGENETENFKHPAESYRNSDLSVKSRNILTRPCFFGFFFVDNHYSTVCQPVRILSILKKYWKKINEILFGYNDSSTSKLNLSLREISVLFDMEKIRSGCRSHLLCTALK